MSDSDPVGRREFVQAVTAVLGSIMGAVIGLPAIGYMLGPALNRQSSEAKIAAGPLENFPDGVPTLFNFTRTKVNGWEKTVNSYGVYVLREGDKVTVLSNRCTHLSCRVKWNQDAQGYLCPCHDAAFNINGSVRSGPPPAPLDALEGVVEEGNIFINWKEG